MKKIKKFIKGEIKSIDKQNKSVTVVVSSIKQDRDGDIILPSAFTKTKKQYMKHPVLLNSHNPYNVSNQIGEATSLKITDDEVVATFKYYADEGNKDADWAWNLAQKGIAGYSIGFVAKKTEELTEKEKLEGRWGRKFTEIELYEISQVLIPCNRSAIQSRLAEIESEKETSFADGEKELLELGIKSFSEEGEEGDKEDKEEDKVKHLTIEDVEKRVSDMFEKLQEKMTDLISEESERIINEKFENGKKRVDSIFGEQEKTNPDDSQQKRNLSNDEITKIVAETIKGINKGK